MGLVRTVLAISIFDFILFPGLALAGHRASARGQAADILNQADARIERVRKGDAVLELAGPDGKPLRNGTRVSIEQRRHRFLFGANIFMLGKCRTEEENAAYAERFARLFNYATAPFYWWAYEPRPGEPNYRATDEILAWCRAHGVEVKGHPLAWNYQDPAWLPNDPLAALKLQFDRIEKCVGHFKGEISYWDVVNEATQYDRPECRAQAPILTAAVERIGAADYIRTAFRTARRANPNARLVINDYRTDSSYADKVISQLVDDGGQTLYDAVGIQCHQHSGAWPPDRIWEICERFSRFGKPLHFTETTFLSGQLGYDLKKNNPNLNWETTPEGERRQAEEVAQFYTVLFSHPAVQAITWWDFSDRGAWQGAPAGVLRQDMSPKPAYETLVRLIKGKWWTRAEALTNSPGQARFRGFYGDYTVSARQHGRELTGAFSFDQTTSGPIKVQLR